MTIAATYALYIFTFGLPDALVYGYPTYAECASAGEREVARITRQKYLPQRGGVLQVL